MEAFLEMTLLRLSRYLLVEPSIETMHIMNRTTFLLFHSTMNHIPSVRIFKHFHKNDGSASIVSMTNMDTVEFNTIASGLKGFVSVGVQRWKRTALQVFRKGRPAYVTDKLKIRRKLGYACESFQTERS